MGICAFGHWDLVKILAGKWEPSAELTHTRARAKYTIEHDSLTYYTASL
jgi:hypothetical protein